MSALPASYFSSITFTIGDKVRTLHAHGKRAYQIQFENPVQIDFGEDLLRHRSPQSSTTAVQESSAPFLNDATWYLTQIDASVVRPKNSSSGEAHTTTSAFGSSASEQSGIPLVVEVWEKLTGRIQLKTDRHLIHETVDERMYLYFKGRELSFTLTPNIRSLTSSVDLLIDTASTQYLTECDLWFSDTRCYVCVENLKTLMPTGRSLINQSNWFTHLVKHNVVLNLIDSKYSILTKNQHLFIKPQSLQQQIYLHFGRTELTLVGNSCQDVSTSDCPFSFEAIGSSSSSAGNTKLTQSQIHHHFGKDRHIYVTTSANDQDISFLRMNILPNKWKSSVVPLPIYNMAMTAMRQQVHQVLDNLPRRFDVQGSLVMTTKNYAEKTEVIEIKELTAATPWMIIDKMQFRIRIKPKTTVIDFRESKYVRPAAFSLSLPNRNVKSSRPFIEFNECTSDRTMSMFISAMGIREYLQGTPYSRGTHVPSEYSWKAQIWGGTSRKLCVTLTGRHENLCVHFCLGCFRKVDLRYGNDRIQGECRCKAKDNWLRFTPHFADTTVIMSSYSRPQNSWPMQHLTPNQSENLSEPCTFLELD